MNSLYPELIPYHTFFLKTGTKHSVYVEESGNPFGFPVIFLHGGPCSGTKPDHRRFFNPQFYRIILIDQRGCGQSLPFGELEDNHTQGLCADLEALRRHLGIGKWLIFGGSWGATLGLYYAQQYPDWVAGLIIRGVFLARQQDLDWFANSGAPKIYPEQWQALLDSLPVGSSTGNLINDLYDAVWGSDEIAQRRVARAWNAWGAQVALGNAYRPDPRDEHVSEKTLKQVRMELHYAKHHYFLRENQILENCGKILKIPTVIIHGRQDLVCPIEAAVKLHQALPHSDYLALPEAGHIAQGDTMIHALVNATDHFMDRLKTDVC